MQSRQYLRGFAALDKVAEQLIHELGQLIDDGAVHFLITGCADVGFIPDYDIDNNDFLDASEQMRSDTATAYSQYLDNLIETQVVPALKAMGATVTYVSMMDGLDAILPTIEALHDLAPGTLTTETADHHQQLVNRELVFFDDIHPNAQVQALFGAYAQAILTNTPWIEILPVADAEVDYALTASIANVGEVDKAVFALAAGIDYRFDMLGMSTLGTAGSLGDPSLRLLTSGGTVAGANADDGAGFDAVLAFSPAGSGTYTLEMSATGSLTGAYQLQVSMSSAAMTAGQTYVVGNAAAIILEGAGWTGVDLVRASTSYALGAGSEIEVLTTSNAKGKTAINLTGNEFNQEITGNAGANILDGKGGTDTLTGGAGKDVFVLGTGGIDAITDYSTGDIVDVSAMLSVAAGTNVVSGGFVRVTTSGLVQVDTSGGGDSWVTLGTINSGGAVTVRYLSGGSLATASLSRVTASATTASLAGAVAAAGLGATAAAADTGGWQDNASLSVSASPAAGGPDNGVAGASGRFLGGETHEAVADLSLSNLGQSGASAAHFEMGSGPAPGPALAASPAALPGATELPLFADHGASLAMAVAMPAAGQLLAMAGPAEAPDVAAILAEAMGGPGQDVTALLDALPAGAAPGFVPGGLGQIASWNMTDGFAFAPAMAGLEMLAMHQDAAVTV